MNGRLIAKKLRELLNECCQRASLRPHAKELMSRHSHSVILKPFSGPIVAFARFAFLHFPSLAEDLLAQV